MRRAGIARRRPAEAMTLTPERTPCIQCGLPSHGGAPFCCYGCRLIHEITQATGDEGRARWILARLGLAAFLAMNVMMFSLIFYGEDVGVRAEDGSLLRSLYRYLLL